jgi:hypothetical protein
VFQLNAWSVSVKRIEVVESLSFFLFFRKKREKVLAVRKKVVPLHSLSGMTPGEQ